MQNRILLVIGASSDVGIAYIKKNHEKYDKILAHYNSSLKELEELKYTLEDKIILFKANLLSEEETEEFVTSIRKMNMIPNHILHFPANKYNNYKFHKIEWKNFQNDIDIQLRSIVYILREFLPQMSKEKYGKIVVMLSSCTENIAPKYLSSYVTVKYALLGLVKALASEYASRGICINGVSPCMMDTKLLSETADLIIHQNAEANPQGRNATVDDVCPLLDFLLSEESKFITGQNIIISGGGN